MSWPTRRPAPPAPSSSRRRAERGGRWGGPSYSRRELRQRPSDHFRARHPLTGDDGVERCDLVGAQTHRDHLHGLRAVPRAPPAATLEGLDVVPGLRLVGPCPDLGLADLVLTHENIVNENRAVLGGCSAEDEALLLASGGVLQRDEDHGVGVGADDGLLGVEVVAMGVRVILNHVLDVEDFVGLLLRD